MEYPEQSWSLKQVAAPQALDLLRGPPHWGTIRAAHLDTGVTLHPALGAWVLVDRGVNYLEPGDKPIDPMTYNGAVQFPGHGTRTCSVLTGLDEAGGFSGVAPRLPVVPYRVTDTVVLTGDQERANLAQAIRHAIDVNACSVITISLGYPLMSPWHNILGAALDYAYQHGIIVVAAGGQKVAEFCYPGKFFRAIGVGGRKGYPGDDGIYQDYQPEMNPFADVWAPADPVMTARTRRDDAYSWTHDYAFGDGTSFATPHVAAAAAMWLLHRGDALLDAYGKDLWKRVEAFRRLAKSTAQDLSSLTGLEQSRPARPGEIPPSKGNHDGDGRFVSGGLDILALLQAELPTIGDEQQAPPAADQWG